MFFVVHPFPLLKAPKKKGFRGYGGTLLYFRRKKYFFKINFIVCARASWPGSPCPCPLHCAGATPPGSSAGFVGSGKPCRLCPRFGSACRRGRRARVPLVLSCVPVAASRPHLARFRSLSAICPDDRRGALSALCGLSARPPWIFTACPLVSVGPDLLPVAVLSVSSRSRAEPVAGPSGSLAGALTLSPSAADPLRGAVRSSRGQPLPWAALSVRRGCPCVPSGAGCGVGRDHAGTGCRVLCREISAPVLAVRIVSGSGMRARRAALSDRRGLGAAYPADRPRILRPLCRCRRQLLRLSRSPRGQTVFRISRAKSCGRGLLQYVCTFFGAPPPLPNMPARMGARLSALSVILTRAPR